MINEMVNNLSKKIEAVGGSKCANMEDVLNQILLLGEKEGEAAFLRVHYKKMIARGLYPMSRLEYSTNYGERWCSVEAKFFANLTDASPLGIGFIRMGVEEVNPDTFLTEEQRMNKIESICRGRAASRALYEAGIGMEFFSDIPETESYENHSPAEISIEMPMTEEVDKETPAKPVVKEKTREENPLATPIIYDEPANPLSAPIIFDEPAATTDTTPSSPEEVVADIGKHKGEKLGDILATDPRNLIFLYNRGGAEVRNAALKICLREENKELAKFLPETARI